MFLLENKRWTFLRYIGPGILVTVGFIDPGNWASNMAAGAAYGYDLLWMVSLSTIMLIILQHNVAHLGIVTGHCLAEAAIRHLPPWVSYPALFTAVLAAVATALAEILGGAVALNMLFGLPVMAGAVVTIVFCSILLVINSYRKLEKIIIAFVSLIGLSFLAEIFMVDVDWPTAARAWVVPSLPEGSLPIVMSVLGAVVMPHNLFLHSEVIKSRNWNLEAETVMRHKLDYEFVDTLFSMGIGWAINSAMIIMAAVAFHQNGILVEELDQAVAMLPILGDFAALLFALAFLLSGIASTVTVGMAGGSIFSGFFRCSYNIRQKYSLWGVALTYGLALLIIAFIENPFTGLVYSQMALSVQLPLTIALEVYLTSSKKVMGSYANGIPLRVLLCSIGLFVTVLNVFLLRELL